MKNQIRFIILLSLMVFTTYSCKTGRVENYGGKDNISYIQLVRGTTDTYKEGVTVYIDNNEPFVAKVNKVDAKTVKGNVYSIQNGNRKIRVEYKGNVLYERDIVIGIGETRKIQLP